MPTRIFRQWLSRKYYTGARNKLKRLDGLSSQPVRESLAYRLWGYYNLPINAVFVTTNVFLFVGVVTCNTLCQLKNERSSKNEFLKSIESETQTGSNIEFTTNEDMKVDTSDPWFVKSSDSTEPLPTNANSEKGKGAVDLINEDIPMDDYSLEAIEFEDSQPLNTITDQTVKYSLFQLFYAFTSYQNINQKRKDEENNWVTDLQKSFKSPKKFNFRRSKTPSSTSSKKTNEGDLTIEQFYSHWKKIFHKKYDSFYQMTHFEISKINECQLMDFAYIVEKLRKINFHDIQQINELYNELDNNQYKKILRIWLYDNIHFLHGTILRDDAIFKNFLHDSINDYNSMTFFKYSSVILNSKKNYRTKQFLPIFSTLQLNFINIGTILDILNKYVALQKEKPIYNNEILQIVKLIKTQGIVDKRGEIQIILEGNARYKYKPINGKPRQMNMNFINKSANYDKYLRELSKNADLQNLLREALVLSSNQDSKPAQIDKPHT